MRSPEEKIVASKNVAELAQRLHQDKLKIVTTNGCFDLLHLGHFEYLREARKLGDVLIVGLNSDASVRKLKGSDRPLNSEVVRARQLAALESVDYISVFNEDTPVEFLQKIRPHFHAKGGDYDISKLPEREIVERSGGKVECLNFIDGYSTTTLIEKLKKR